MLIFVGLVGKSEGLGKPIFIVLVSGVLFNPLALQKGIYVLSVVLSIELLKESGGDIDPLAVGLLNLRVSVEEGIKKKGMPTHTLQFPCFCKGRNGYAIVVIP